MEELIGLISDNFIIVIIIIGGIISFLKNTSTSEDEENDRKRNQYNAPRPTATPSGGRQQVDRRTAAEKQRQPEMSSLSIEDQQKEQMKQLAGRMGASTKGITKELTGTPHKANVESTLREPKIVKPYHHEQFKKEIKGKLNQRGLIDSIVMAEVLGPSRAKKPYRSVIADRNR